MYAVISTTANVINANGECEERVTYAYRVVKGDVERFK